MKLLKFIPVCSIEELRSVDRGLLKQPVTRNKFNEMRSILMNSSTTALGTPRARIKLPVTLRKSTTINNVNALSHAVRRY